MTLGAEERADWGRRLRDARKARRWRQSDLAELLGHSDYFTVSRWERGIHLPEGANLVALGQQGPEFMVLTDELRSIGGPSRIDGLIERVAELVEAQTEATLVVADLARRVAALEQRPAARAPRRRAQGNGGS